MNRAVFSPPLRAGWRGVPGRRPPCDVAPFLVCAGAGGNAKTSIIACVSPSEESAQETHSTLVFAAGAKKIRNKVGARLAALLAAAEKGRRGSVCCSGLCAGVHAALWLAPLHPLPLIRFLSSCPFPPGRLWSTGTRWETCGRCSWKTLGCSGSLRSGRCGGRRWGQAKRLPCPGRRRLRGAVAVRVYKRPLGPSLPPAGCPGGRSAAAAGGGAGVGGGGSGPCGGGGGAAAAAGGSAERPALSAAAAQRRAIACAAGVP